MGISRNIADKKQPHKKTRSQNEWDNIIIVYKKACKKDDTKYRFNEFINLECVIRMQLSKKIEKNEERSFYRYLKLHKDADETLMSDSSSTISKMKFPKIEEHVNVILNQNGRYKYSWSNIEKIALYLNQKLYKYKKFRASTNWIRGVLLRRHNNDSNINVEANDEDSDPNWLHGVLLSLRNNDSNINVEDNENTVMKGIDDEIKAKSLYLNQKMYNYKKFKASPNWIHGVVQRRRLKSNKEKNDSNINVKANDEDSDNAVVENNNNENTVMKGIDDAVKAKSNDEDIVIHGNTNNVSIDDAIMHDKTDNTITLNDDEEIKRLSNSNTITMHVDEEIKRSCNNNVIILDDDEEIKTSSNSNTITLHDDEQIKGSCNSNAINVDNDEEIKRLSKGNTITTHDDEQIKRSSKSNTITTHDDITLDDDEQIKGSCKKDVVTLDDDSDMDDDTKLQVIPYNEINFVQLKVNYHNQFILLIHCIHLSSLLFQICFYSNI